MSSAPFGGRRLAAALAVARRDLLEFVRDRRTLVITLLMPMVMYPVLAMSSLLGLRTALSDIEARQAARRLVVAVSGADAEPFAARMREAVAAAAADPPADWPAGVAVDVIAPEEAAARLDSGRADVWLPVGAGTVANLDGSGTVRLDVRASRVRPMESRVRGHCLAVLEAVANDARARRVARAGLAATTLAPLTVDFPAGGPAGADAARGVLPTAAGAVLVLLALLTATGAFYPAIDAIAGEKERGTIETLLIAPCRAGDIVFGKYLAVLAVTLATLAMNAVSIGLTGTVLARYMPSGFLGVGLVGLAACAAVALVAYLGLASVAASLCLAVTSASKSVKEAQNTLTPVILLVSGLAGAALLPGLGTTALAAVPFAGQVAVAKAVLEVSDPPADMADQLRLVGLRLAFSLAASGLVSWLLLRATTAAVTDEEILFRGPDAVAARGWRPAPRAVPTAGQGVAAAAIGLAGLWYAQGLAPADLGRAIPVHMALATLLPLVILGWWQRVDRGATFRLRRPAGTAGRGLTCLAAAAVAGGCLFVAGAGALLALRGDQLSPEARDLATRIMALLGAKPLWAVWLLLAVLPAVCEEALFRGWMLAGLAGERPSRGRALTAVVVQAACFAAFHLLPERMPQTLALGLLLGWMTLRCGSLLPAVLGHLAHNSVPLGLVALAADTDAARHTVDSAPALPPGMLVAAVGCLGVAVAAFWLATRGPRRTVAT
ncbi:MAG: type II CAAX prenyl endopeptidase Rce1 family protein [Planctomycetia bacterium]